MKRVVSPNPTMPAGRHPDRDYRVESLLQGYRITAPVGYMLSAALAALLAILLPVITTQFGSVSVSPGALTGRAVFIDALTPLFFAIAVICGWKGIAWRLARRAYSQATGRPDLGYFGIWDGLGERTDEEIAEEAETLVRANRARQSE